MSPKLDLGEACAHLAHGPLRIIGQRLAGVPGNRSRRTPLTLHRLFIQMPQVGGPDVSLIEHGIAETWRPGIRT